MRISNSLHLSLQNVFYISNRSPRGNSDIDSRGKSVIVKRIENRRIVPSMCMKEVAYYISSTPRLQDICTRDIIIPMTHTHRMEKKTSDSIIGICFRSGYMNDECALTYVDTTKGYGYYGGRGVILDDTYKPLIICGFEVEVTRTYYRYIQPVCIISPEVFGREDMVSKSIVKKLLPYFSVEEFHCGGDVNDVRCDAKRVKVIISDEINKFIHHAVPPMDVDVDGALYDILSNSFPVNRQEL